MRASISLIALFAAFPAQADTFVAQAPVAAATIYPDGGTLTLRASLDMPAGEHLILIPYPRDALTDSLPRIAASENVTIGALGFRPDVLTDPETLYTEAQRAAAARVETLSDEVEATLMRLKAERATIRGLEAKAGFLADILPPSDASADEMITLAEAVASQTAETEAAIVAAEIALGPLYDAADALEEELARAKAALDRLSPPGDSNDMLTVSLTVAQAGPVALELTEQTWAVGWDVDYDMNLDREAGMVTLDRKVIIYQDSERAWTDVDLTLATARPNDQIAPTQVRPDRAGLFNPQLARASAAPDAAMESERAEEPMAELAVVEPVIVTAGLQVDGLSVTYVYSEPVSIAPGDAAELALDTLTIAAETHLQATPRWDETAFLMATLTNDTGQPILPGNVSLSRDGHFVGQSDLDLIPAGAEEVLAFGPIEGLRLDAIFKRNEEGDAGLINKSATRVQQITFTVENLTGETQEVRALYPLTFSELEDLSVEVTATPAPDETDVDDKRGVSAWDLTITPGETAEVQIVVDMDWPEGQVLDWRP